MLPLTTWNLPLSDDLATTASDDVEDTTTPNNIGVDDELNNDITGVGNDITPPTLPRRITIHQIP